MIRDITLGQYYPTDSVLHRLDPRVKLCGTLIYVISLFLFQTFTGYIVATVFLVSMIALSHVPVKFIFRGLKAILFILVFTAVLNTFLTPGRELVSFWRITITIEGVRLAAFMILRLVYLIIGSSLPGIRILIHPDIICFPNASIDIYRVRNDLIRKRRSVLWKEDIFVCRDLDRVGSKRSRFDRR